MTNFNRPIPTHNFKPENLHRTNILPTGHSVWTYHGLFVEKQQGIDYVNECGRSGAMADGDIVILCLHDPDANADIAIVYKVISPADNGNPPSDHERKIA